jgi:hypothetical protein
MVLCFVPGTWVDVSQILPQPLKPGVYPLIAGIHPAITRKPAASWGPRKCLLHPVMEYSNSKPLYFNGKTIFFSPMV